jgi:hypothetical protein
MRQKERRAVSSPDIAVEEVRASIAARLQRVCSDWDPGDFDALVSHVADIAMKYDLGEESDRIVAAYDRRQSERRVEDRRVDDRRVTPESGGRAE